MGAALFFPGRSARLLAQNRMTYSVVSRRERPRRARPGAPQAQRRGHVHAGAGASRRRAQRAVRAVHARHGPALDRSCRPTAAKAARTRSAPSCSATSACCARPSCSPRTASTAPSSTSRAPSTTATRSSPQEVIDKWGREEIVGDFVRLIRTLPPRRHPDDEHPGPRRRPRARSDHRSWRARRTRRRAIRRSIPSRSAKACGRGSRRSCTSPAAAA